MGVAGRAVPVASRQSLCNLRVESRGFGAPAALLSLTRKTRASKSRTSALLRAAAHRITSSVHRKVLSPSVLLCLRSSCRTAQLHLSDGTQVASLQPQQGRTAICFAPMADAPYPEPYNSLAPLRVSSTAMSTSACLANTCAATCTPISCLIRCSLPAVCIKLSQRPRAGYRSPGGRHQLHTHFLLRPLWLHFISTPGHTVVVVQ